MSQTLQSFESSLTGILTALEGTVEPANGELSDGAKRGLGIIASIQSYGVDMTREKAEAAMNIVNQRIATAKAAANALEPIDFDTIWPVEAGATVSEVIANESEPDPE